MLRVVLGCFVFWVVLGFGLFWDLGCFGIWVVLDFGLFWVLGCLGFGAVYVLVRGYIIGFYVHVGECV